MRKLLIGVGAVVGLAVALGFAAPLLIDLNAQKPRITALIEEATGHRVSLGGDIRFGLLPVPEVSVRDIVVEGEGAETPQLARIDQLDLRLALLPLLGGAIDVSEIRLGHPVVTLVEAAAPAKPTATGKATDVPVVPGEAGFSGTIALQRVVVEDGQVEYRARDGVQHHVTGIEAMLSAPSLQGPFSVSGGATYQGMPLVLDLVLGRLVPGEPAGFDAKLGLAGAGVTSSGTIDLSGSAPRIDGKAALSIDDAAAFAGLTGMNLPLAGAFTAEGRLKASAEAIALDDLTVTAGEARGTGSLAVALGDVPAVSLKLRLPMLDVDALRAAAGKAKPDTAAVEPKPAEPPAPPAPVSLPQAVTADLDLAVDAVRYGGAVIQKVAVVATLEGGRLTLSKASAVLPGGTDFGLSGGAASRDGRLRFTGTIDVASDSPRALTDWLKITPEGLPADRLTRFDLTAKLVTDGIGGTLNDLVVRLDGATAKGSAGWQPGPRPVAMLSLDVDKFDLDAYHASIPAPAAPVAAASNPLSQIGATKTVTPFADLGFDLALRLSAGSLTVGGGEARAVLVDGTLSPDVLRFNQFSVGDYAGLALDAKGKLGLAAEATEGDFELRLTAPSPAPLFALAGLPAPQDASALGAFTLEAHVTGKPDSPAVDAKLLLGETRVALTGSIGRLDAIAFDLQGSLTAPELVAAARQFGLTPAPAGPVLGPVDLAVTLRGVPATPSFTVKGKLGPADLSASAEVVAEGGYKLSARLTGAASAGMLTRLGLTGPVSGPLDLQLAAGGTLDRMVIDSARLNAGDNDLKLKGTLERGAVTRFDGEIRAASLDLGLFDSGDEPATKPGNASGGERAKAARWSAKPFDLASFRAFAGGVDIAADRLVSGDRLFTGVAARLDAEGGRIALDGLKATVDQGALAGSIVFDASAEVPELAVDLQAEGIDIAKLNPDTGAVDGIGVKPGLTGRGTFGITLEGRGRSTFEIVSSLAGKGAVVASNGKIRGLDLKVLSEGLATVNQPGDILGRIARSIRSGSTDYRQISTALVVEKGVVRLDGLGSDMDGGRLSGEGTVDLPAWVTKIRLALTLNAPTDLPPLGIDINGPPDALDGVVRTREIEAYYLQKFVGSKLPSLPQGGSGKAIVDQLLKGLGGN